MIPANVKTAIQGSYHLSHANLAIEGQGNIQSANNVIRHSAARQVDEPGPGQARSIDKILRTPATIK